MNSVSIFEYVWMWLRRIPRSVWIGGALLFVATAALLIWLLMSLVSGAWQAGTSLVESGREKVTELAPEINQLATGITGGGTAAEVLEQVGIAPEQVAQVQTTVEQLRQTIPESAGMLQRELEGVIPPELVAQTREIAEQGRSRVQSTAEAWLGTPVPVSDVRGEDPPGVERLPGFVRTEFARDGERLRVVLVGETPFPEVVAHYERTLAAKGYETRVLQAGAEFEMLEFVSSQGTLTLRATREESGGTRIVWTTG